MRLRKAFLPAVLLLAGCTEGVAPHAPGRYVAPPETPVVEPVSPTDVLGEPGASARPPPAPVPDTQPLPEPEPPPLSGSAAVVGLEEGRRGLSTVSQVDVDLTVEGVRGRGTVDVEFISPAGHPYERRSTVVEAPPQERRTLRFSLPVAATTVSTTGMSGTWQVRFFLDGAPLTTAAFTLEP
jgi:hypothetical protein